MGGIVDESLLSTASTLIDSFSASLDGSLDGDVDQVEKGKVNKKANPLLCRGKINSFAKGRLLGKNWNVKIASPTTTAVNLEINECVNDKSERSTGSKLDHLRARTSLLRKLSTEIIEESRASLRKSRTISIESPPSPQPPPYPPPSVHNEVTSARIQQEHSETTKEFTDYLRRSNNVIDLLSTEIAMAGSIMNESTCHGDRTLNDTASNKTNDFVSNLYGHNFYHEIGKGQKSIPNDDNSIHNISVGEDWDQTTISATDPGSPSSSVYESQKSSCKASTSRRLSSSGLPPPEVLVKRITPRVATQVAPQAVEAPFGTSSSTFAPRAQNEDRHREQRPTSIHSRGECSMYNTNQKCEKLALENDCLKRQMDLLENRHRDSQRKLMEKLQRQEEQEVQEEQFLGLMSSSTNKKSKKTIYGFYRKIKKSDRRRLLVILVLAPFLLSSTLWLYRSARSVSSSGISDSSNADRIGLASMMRGGGLRQALFGESVLSDITDDADIEDDCVIDDFVDEPTTFLIVHEPTTKHQEFNSAEQEESKFGKKVNRFKQFASRMKIPHDQNPMGVWLKKHQQIKTKEHHAEL